MAVGVKLDFKVDLQGTPNSVLVKEQSSSQGLKFSVVTMDFYQLDSREAMYAISVDL